MLPDFILPAQHGYVFILDQEEDYFIYFQSIADNYRVLVEFETKNDSSKVLVSYDDLNEVIFEALILLGDYNYVRLRRNSNYLQLMSIFEKQVYENTTV